MTPIGFTYGLDLSYVQLQYALSAAECGSFSSAARLCGVSQPALSSGVAALERTLRMTLFQRGAGGVELTDAGQTLLPLLRATVTNVDHLVSAAHQLAEQRPAFRLGVSPLVSPDLIAGVFAAARLVRSDTPIAVTEANLDELERALLAGRLDLTLTPSVGGDHDDLLRRHIRSEPLCYIAVGDGERFGAVGEGERFGAVGDGTVSGEQSGSGRTQLADVVGRTFVLLAEGCGLTLFTRSAIEAAGGELHAHDVRATSYQRLFDWADLGLGDVLVPESKVPAGRVSNGVFDGDEQVEIGFEARWRRRSDGDPQITAIVTALSTS
ncbi:MAG: DNA-binding transcriptional LysR family regulator [Acidimicrobiales bacterium]|jgi:DNA-binding transcriptional LysR family regulator